MNTKIRLYFYEKIQNDLVAHLNKDQSHYLKDVMRLKEGGLFSIFNNQFSKRIYTFNKEEIIL